ncbi:MAG: hypothetical protein HYX51_08890 [Chloroflexi bacterium]|nr:hypothetical protein [Chloroflexota bacterium]
MNLDGEWRVTGRNTLAAAVLRPLGGDTSPCRREALQTGRLLTEPVAMLGGAESLRRVATDIRVGQVVEYYQGSVSMARLYAASAALLGLDTACARTMLGFMLRTAGYPSADTDLARAELVVGQADGFPYRIRFALRSPRGDEVEFDASLLPSPAAPRIDDVPGARRVP